MSLSRNQFEALLGRDIAERMNGLYGGTLGFSERCYSSLGYGNPKSCSTYLSNLRRGLIRGHSGKPIDLGRQLLRLAIVLYHLKLEKSSDIIKGIRSLEPDFNFPPPALAVLAASPRKSLEEKMRK